MADARLEKRSVTIELLGDDFLKAVKTGDPVKVHADGTVEDGWPIHYATIFGD